jgi:hypothetical protein
MKIYLPILAVLLFSLSTVSATPNLDLFGGFFDNEIFSGSTATSTTDGTDFGERNVDDGFKFQLYDIVNNGSSNLSVTGFINSNPSQFTVLDFPTVPIAPGGSHTFRITFDPTSVGQHTSTFALINNSSESPFSFRITGSGIIAPFIRLEGRSDSGSPYVQFFDGHVTPEATKGTLFAATTTNTTISHQFRVNNTGGATMTLAHSENSPHFQVLGLAGSIAAGASDTFTILFTPTTTGVLSTNITIGTNSSNTTSFNFTVEGFGNGPDLNVLGGPTLLNSIFDGDNSPSSFDGTDFGSLHINGGTKTNTFRARNLGNQNLSISSATITGPDASHFILAGLGSFIIQGGYEDFTITFDPSSIGAKQAELRIESTDPDESPYTFAIWGNGVGTPSFTLSGSGKEIENGSTVPQAVNDTLFTDTEVGQTQSHDFVITNSGTDTLTITPPTSGQHFSVAGVATSLAPGQSDTFTLAFTPTTHGLLSRTISIASNDPDDDPFTFVVQGTGLAPAFFVYGGPTPSGILIPNNDTTPRAADGTDFGNVLTSVDNVSHTFHIPNTGNILLKISKISLDGVQASSFSLGAYETDVPAGSTIDVTVNFTPTSDGLRTATLVIESNIAPYSFAIAGTGISVPDIRVQGGVTTSSLADIDNGSSTAITANGTLFPDTAAGSSATTKIRLFNDGNASINISKSSSDPQFTVSLPASVNYGPGGFHTFDLTFTPTSAGPQTATITITSDDPDENPYTFLVQGNGLAPEIAVFGGTMLTEEITNGDMVPTTAKGTDFGDINLNQSDVTRLFRIENSGNQTLNFSGFSISDPANYSVNFFFSSLTPMTAGEFTITCHPVLPVGTKAATLTLHNNDPDEDEYTFGFTAAAVTAIAGPDLKVFGGNTFTQTIGAGDLSPQNATHFGVAPVGSAPVTRTFQIKNTGGANLTNISTSSTHPDLTIAGGNSSALGANKTITFNATFTPATVGFQTALIEIASNDPNENPYTFAVGFDVLAAPSTPPTITSFEINGTTGTATFLTQSGKTYTLKTSTTLQTGSWLPVPGTTPVSGTGTPETFTFNTTGPIRFYRIEVQ